MRILGIPIALLCTIGLSCVFMAHAADSIPAKGAVFPEITLIAPADDVQRSYLGLQGTESFSLSKIKADVVIIEIFSMYCPYCQKEAPLVNELYRTIDKDPSLRDKIKMIGIGAGNTAFEVDIFKNQYGIPFPLFDDPSFTVHKKLGEVRTPYFFVLRMNADGASRIIYSKVGTIEDPSRFLNLILQDAGMK